MEKIEMKLYYAPGACSLAVHIVAREAQIPVQLVKVDIFKHTLTDGSDYLAIHPRGYVPLIEMDDGERFSEVAALVQLVAERAENTVLLPLPGSREHIRVQTWLTFVATELHKTFSPWLWHSDTAESTKNAARQKLASRYAELNQVLQSNLYLTGHNFTVADAYAFAIIRWSDLLSVDLTPFPNLRAFLERVAARPAVRQALSQEGLLKSAA